MEELWANYQKVKKPDIIVGIEQTSDDKSKIGSGDWIQGNEGRG